MLLSKTVELKRYLAQLVNSNKPEQYPVVITFSRGIEFPKYKITIEEHNEDFFVDAKGFKWVKEKVKDFE